MGVLARGSRAAVVVLALAAMTVVTTASPASAHGLGGLQPTNYETRILNVEPAVRGVTIRAGDAGTKLELTNLTRHDVVVLGYDGEPYLRVGPKGTFENIRSPATYINRTVRGTTEVPDSADADAPAAWVRTSRRTTVLWHDHRAHWMGLDLPPIVQRDSSAQVVIQRWHIDLRLRDGSRASGLLIRVAGDLRWVPGPSLLPWLVPALGLAVALAVAARTRRWATALAAGLGVLLVASVLHLAGMWGGSTASTASRLGGSVYQLGGIAVTAVAVVVLVRRNAVAAVPWAFIGALFLLLTGGVADVSTLTHSQLPTTIPAWLDRLAVALTIGTAAGVAIVAALHAAPEGSTNRMLAIRHSRASRGDRSSPTRSRDTRARALRARSRTAPPTSP